jgi:hypothetical protein
VKDRQVTALTIWLRHGRHRSRYCSCNIL